MADLLADMKMQARYTVRTQAAFVRTFKALHTARPGETTERIPAFDIRSLHRIHDMNPAVYVCAVTLLDAGVEQDVDVIRDSKQFRGLVDRLGLQPSSGSRDAKHSHRASLALLEVFAYMIIIHRARVADAESKTPVEEDELI